VAIAAAGDALAGTGLLLGSTELFGAGMAVYGAATAVENALLGVSTEVVANETTAIRTSNEIGAWGEQQVGEQLPVQIQQVRIPGGERVYDGYFMDNPQAYVEIKTSTRGVVYATQSIRNQITVKFLATRQFFARGHCEGAERPKQSPKRLIGDCFAPFWGSQ
jgi:hypothetical protein